MVGDHLWELGCWLCPRWRKLNETVYCTCSPSRGWLGPLCRVPWACPLRNAPVAAIWWRCRTSYRHRVSHPGGLEWCWCSHWRLAVTHGWSLSAAAYSGSSHFCGRTCVLSWKLVVFPSGITSCLSESVCFLVDWRWCNPGPGDVPSPVETASLLCWTEELPLLPSCWWWPWACGRRVWCRGRWGLGQSEFWISGRGRLWTAGLACWCLWLGCRLLVWGLVLAWFPVEVEPASGVVCELGRDPRSSLLPACWNLRPGGCELACGVLLPSLARLERPSSSWSCGPGVCIRRLPGWVAGSC